MREVNDFLKILAAGFRTFRRHKKAVHTALAVLGSIVAFSLLKTFVQPANAMGAGTTVPLGSYYGDSKAFYCSRFGIQGASVASVCQAPEMSVELTSAAIPQRGAVLSGSCLAYDSTFRQFAWDASTAEAICQAESGGNPYAVSSTNDYGLMQLHNMAIYDPSENIAAAYRKYEVQGWWAWTTYVTGAYVQFR